MSQHDGGIGAPNERSCFPNPGGKTISLGPLCPFQAWKGLQAGGRSCGCSSFGGDGEPCGRARTPPGALPGRCQGPRPPSGAFDRRPPRKLRGSQRGRPPAGRGSLGEARTQGPRTNDTLRTGSLAFDRLAEISQASRAFKHTQGLNYSESSAETIRIKERKADGAIK